MNDMTMTIKVDAPDLVAAIVRLAAAVDPDPNSLTTNTLQPQTPANENPIPVAGSAPTAQTAGPVAPLAGQTSACHSNPAPPAPAVPVAGAPAYTLDQISKAGAALVDAGKMEPLLALLAKYGVKAITQLQPAQYGVFATELRALGAQI